MQVQNWIQELGKKSGYDMWPEDCDVAMVKTNMPLESMYMQKESRLDDSDDLLHGVRSV